MIGPGADSWLAGCCDDSGLAESRRLRAEVDEARARGRVLSENVHIINDNEKTLCLTVSSRIQYSRSFLPVEYLSSVPCSICQT